MSSAIELSLQESSAAVEASAAARRRRSVCRRWARSGVCNFLPHCGFHHPADLVPSNRSPAAERVLNVDELQPRRTERHEHTLESRLLRVRRELKQKELADALEDDGLGCLLASLGADPSEDSPQVEDASLAALRLEIQQLELQVAAEKAQQQSEEKKTKKKRTRVKCAAQRPYLFCMWLQQTFGTEYIRSGCGVLDVAGGRGDISFILSNVHQLTSTLVDPRAPNHRKIGKRIERYFKLGLNHLVLQHSQHDSPPPTSSSTSSSPSPSSLSPSPPPLIESGTLTSSSSNSTGSSSPSSYESFVRTPPNLQLCFPSPCHHHFQPLWNSIPPSVSCSGTKTAYPEPRDGADLKDFYCLYDKQCQAVDSQTRSQQDLLSDWKQLETLMRDCSIIIGFHPDQPTEAIVDWALRLDKPFAVLPCCEHASLFPLRRVPQPPQLRDTVIADLSRLQPQPTATDIDAKHMYSHAEPSPAALVGTHLLTPSFKSMECLLSHRAFCDYLKAKDASIKEAILDFTGRNILLYRLPNSFDPVSS